MNDGLTVVLDVGKTHAKLSAWDPQGRFVDRWIHTNEPRVAAEYRILDVEGIDRWLLATLAICARLGRVGRIVPVGHGAAAAVLRDGRLLAGPMDYEEAVSEEDRRAYAVERDPFSDTGSPFLPGALNLGMQLHMIEALSGPLPADATILPWPQYWAWRLSGIEASEVTSLGCHSDLWRPIAADFSGLAIARGWAERMAPLRKASERLGTIKPDIAEATGLPQECEVLCGLHDSNAALLGSRGHDEIADHEATVVSTGTWFVAMRLPGPNIAFDAASLPKNRDCLINVDVDGRPVPSSRFMGGRESEVIRGPGAAPASNGEPSEALLERVPALIARNACAIPSFVPGVGPFPVAEGRLLHADEDPRDRHVVSDLYLALMTNILLELIGSSGRLLVEGRFAEDPMFVRALAAMQPQLSVYTCSAQDDLAYGALRLVDPTLRPPSTLNRVQPLDLDLAAYRGQWRRLVSDSPAPSQTRVSTLI